MLGYSMRRMKNEYVTISNEQKVKRGMGLKNPEQKSRPVGLSHTKTKAPPTCTLI